MRGFDSGSRATARGQIGAASEESRLRNNACTQGVPGHLERASAYYRQPTAREVPALGEAPATATGLHRMAVEEDAQGGAGKTAQKAAGI